MHIPRLPRALLLALAALLGVTVLGVAAFRPDGPQSRVLRAAESPVSRPAVAAADPAIAERARLERVRADSVARAARADSIARAEEEAERAAAQRRASGPRLVISLERRRLWWMDKQDTLFSAPIAVGKGTALEFGDRTWKFDTPRGERTVLAKETDPVWIPPLWHFVEHARKTNRAVRTLEPGREVELLDGSRLVFRGDTVGQLLFPDSVFIPIPPGQEIVFDQTVYVPPVSSVNRRVAGELGKYKLDLGDGYLLHGTRDATSIGSAATHGCIRLGDEDLEYLYEKIPVGTPVFIR